MHWYHVLCQLSTSSQLPAPIHWYVVVVVFWHAFNLTQTQCAAKRPVYLLHRKADGRIPPCAWWLQHGTMGQVRETCRGQATPTNAHATRSNSRATTSNPHATSTSRKPRQFLGNPQQSLGNLQAIRGRHHEAGSGADRGGRAAGPLQLRGGGPSKPVRIRRGRGVIGNGLEGPSCKISHNDAFLQGLAEGKGMVLSRPLWHTSWSCCNMSVGANKHPKASRK